MGRHSSNDQEPREIKIQQALLAEFGKKKQRSARNVELWALFVLQYELEWHEAQAAICTALKDESPIAPRPFVWRLSSA